MIVISDTSPIRALAGLGLLDLLPILFGTIYVPPAVVSELGRPPADKTVVPPDLLPFAQIRPPANRRHVQALLNDLDAGESEAIALAVELKADRVLIDEALGRGIATREGLRPMGVLAILAEAKSRKLVREVKPLLDQLRGPLKFFISNSLYRQVLKDLGEG